MSDIVPLVAIKTHSDQNPEPRPDEIVMWNQMRRNHEMDEILALILLPNSLATGGLFPGFDHHEWIIYEKDNEVVCERTCINFQVIPDGP